MSTQSDLDDAARAASHMAEAPLFATPSISDQLNGGASAVDRSSVPAAPGHGDVTSPGDVSLAWSATVTPMESDLMRVETMEAAVSAAPPPPPSPPQPAPSQPAQQPAVDAAEVRPAQSTTAGAPPAPAPAAPQGQNDQIAALAAEVVRLVDEYEAGERAGAGHAVEAAELLSEIERENDASPVVDEQLKALRWEAVVAARNAYRQLLDGDVAPTVAVTPSDLVDAELLHREFEQAEAKARRSMSGPGAFKKFAAARKALNEFLNRFGVDSYSALQQLAAAAGAGGPATLQEASDAVAAAESDWLALESAASSDGLAATPEMDALRVRAYRLLGAVVDDAELMPRLSALASTAVDQAPTLRQLTLALRALGLPADADPVASARAIRNEVRRV